MSTYKSEYEEVMKYVDLYYSDEPFSDELINTSMKEKNRWEMYRKAGESRVYDEELLPGVERIFEHYYVKDMTDDEDYDCYLCEILLHRDQDILDNDTELMEELKGARYDLRIYFSVLAPYCYWFVTELNYDPSSDDWDMECCYPEVNEEECAAFDEIRPQLEELEGFVKSFGYAPMKTVVAAQRLPEKGLEYIEKGKARVFDCIFTQVYGADFNRYLSQEVEELQRRQSPGLRM